MTLDHARYRLLSWNIAKLTISPCHLADCVPLNNPRNIKYGIDGIGGTCGSSHVEVSKGDVTASMELVPFDHGGFYP